MIVQYAVPTTIREVWDLVGSGGRTKFILGGSEAHRQAAESSQEWRCIDVSRIEEMGGIEERPDSIRIGAAVRIRDVATSSVIASECHALVDAARDFASPQIRNQGTVVGNLCTGRAVAAFSVAGKALGLTIEVQDKDGVSLIEPSALRQAVARGKLVTAAIMSRASGQRGSAYVYMGGRAGFTFPGVAVAASLEVDGGILGEVRAVVAPTLQTPASKNLPPCDGCGGVCRLCVPKILHEIGLELTSKEASPELIVKAVDKADWDSVYVRESALYGSADYRRQVMKSLVKRAFGQALQRAKVAGKDGGGHSDAS